MPTETRGKFKRIVWPMAIAQTLLWAGVYYLFPALLAAWEQDLGWSRTELVGAFTLALLLSALIAPFVGRQIDDGHSDIVFPAATVAAAVLLAALTQVTALWQFYLVWGLIGIAMAGSLYECCFAILTRYMGTRTQQAITLVTLLAGFAGTLAFPTSHALLEGIGWRGVALVFAGLIACVAAPLNYYAVTQAYTANPAPPEPDAPNTGKEIDLFGNPVLWLLGLAFATIALNHGALIAHLLTLLAERGVGAEVAVLAAAMIGPMQVLGRLAMMAMERSVRPPVLAVLSCLAMSVAALALFFAGGEPMFLVLFVILQGVGYGVTSILRPLLVAELLGRRRFGVIAGILAVPFLVAFALAPSVAGLVWSAGGYDAVILLAGGVTLLGAAALWRAGRVAAVASDVDGDA